MRFLLALLALGFVSASAPAFADAASETKPITYFAKEPEREKLGSDYAGLLTDGKTMDAVLSQIVREIPQGTVMGFAAKTEIGLEVVVYRAKDAESPTRYLRMWEGVATGGWTNHNQALMQGLILNEVGTHTMSLILPARLLAADVTQEEMATLLAPAQKLLDDFANEQY